MKAFRALLRISFVEFLRERIVWICFFVAMLLIAFSMVLGSLSFSEQQRILADFGWLAIQLSGLGIGLFLGCNWLQKELNNQTCLLVLARPISRWQFFIGKYFGIFILIFLLEIILALCLWALLEFSFQAGHFFEVFYGTFLEGILVFSLTFAAATFVRPAVAFLFGLSVFLAGHWMQELKFFGEKIKNPVFAILGSVLHWICPNLYELNWRSFYFLETGVSFNQMVWVAFHSLGWIFFAISLGIFVFKRRDLV